MEFRFEDDETDVSQLRVYAWLIDLLLVAGLILLVKGRAGGIVAVLYWLLRDGCFKGQSIGKRLMRLRVVLQDNTPCTFAVSLLRNFLWVIPLLNILVAVNGLIHLAKKPPGHHWGDRLAETNVVRA